MKPSANCPITGAAGKPRRRFEAAEIVRLYKQWLDITLPEELIGKYFSHSIQEYECRQSGMRWYEPGKVGESDFYEMLQAVPWYYGSLGWDKLKAIEILKERKVERFFEPGCGDGLFLAECERRGLRGFGSEINRDAIETGRRKGLTIYDANEMPCTLPPHEAIVSLQTLEHTDNPVEFLRSILKVSDARLIIIAVPCYETMLGLTSDPLVFPPHHYTAWSKRGMASLAEATGLTLEKVYYDEIGMRTFVRGIVNEPGRSGARFPFIRKASALALYLVGRSLGRRWARSGHSILAVFSRRAESRSGV